MNIGNRNLYIN